MQHNLPFQPSDMYSHFRPASALHRRPANGRSAATSDVPVLQYLLTLSATMRHSFHAKTAPSEGPFLVDIVCAGHGTLLRR